MYRICFTAAAERSEENPKILTDKVWETSLVTKFLLHQTDQNGLSHVIRPQEVYLLVPTLWLNSVKLKGVSSRFYNKTYKDELYINIIIVYTT